MGQYLGILACKRFSFRQARSLACASVFFALLGCVPRQDPSVVLIRDGLNQNVSPGDVAIGKAGPLLHNVHEYALMSAMVYADSANRSACGRDLSNGMTDRFRWERPQGLVESWQLATPAGRWKIGEVKYDVWVNDGTDKPTQVAIVFRGTDPGKLSVWWANFRWLTRLVWFSWDQYDQVRDSIGPMIDNIRIKYGESAKIIAVGHSLGGGLAQQAAYEDGRIDLVYAFDPSTVTGYYSVQPPERRFNNEQDLNIYRIYENGEILSYLRWLMKQVYPVHVDASNPKIVEVRYALSQDHNIITLHSMEDFACRLEQIDAFMHAEDSLKKDTIDSPI